MSTNPIRVLDRLIDAQSALGEFIANGPDSGLAGYVRDGYRTRCNQAANVPSWLLNLSPIAKQTLSNFCTPWYDKQGADGFQPGPLSVSGGQCPGVRYLVIATGTNNTTGASFSSNRGVHVGPITKGSRPNQTPNCNVNQVFTNNVIFSGTGAEIIAQVGCAPLQGTLFATCTPETPGSEPAGGCGNQDDEPPTPGPNPPANPGPLPGPEPTDDPTGSPFPLLPIPDFPGDFSPVPIEAPPGDEPAPVPPTASPGGDTSPGDPDSVGDPAGTTPDGGGEVTFGSPPPGRAWVGAFVRLNVPSAYGSIPSANPENTAFPRVLGNAFLIFSGVRFSTAFRLTCEENDLFRPHPTLIVLGVSVSCLPGITATIYPVSAEICPESECPNT